MRDLQPICELALASVLIGAVLGVIIGAILGLILRVLIRLFNRYADWSIARDMARVQRLVEARSMAARAAAALRL